MTWPCETVSHHKASFTTLTLPLLFLLGSIHQGPDRSISDWQQSCWQVNIVAVAPHCRAPQELCQILLKWESKVVSKCIKSLVSYSIIISDHISIYIYIISPCFFKSTCFCQSNGPGWCFFFQPGEYLVEVVWADLPTRAPAGTHLGVEPKLTAIDPIEIGGCGCKWLSYQPLMGI